MSLVRFMKYFIVCIGKAFEARAVQDMGSAIPVTLATVYQLLELDKGNFISYGCSVSQLHAFTSNREIELQV